MTDAPISTRQHAFDVKAVLIPLKDTLPQSTIIHKEWPNARLRKKDLPTFISIATTSIVHRDVEATGVMMGEPIHVVQGDLLHITLRNSLPATGLSLHFHGFELEGQLEFDGVVGVTQCPLSPHQEMTYSFIVNETPGTYWYHTHSGNIGVDAMNAIKGPLIVHPKGFYSESMVDAMKASFVLSTEDSSKKSTSNLYRPLTAYKNERILFFSDNFLMSDSQKQLYSVGGLNPPVSKNDDGFTVGTFPFDFGTCNGKLREVVHVAPGGTYKLRLFNAGSMYAFRIQVDGFPMTVVAADSERVQPYDVDEVILHAAERFDVEITIPPNKSIGSTYWIRADTLESEKQGYQNGIRAILHVTDQAELAGGGSLNDEDIVDPSESIEKAVNPTNEKVTMNCYSKSEDKCLPLTALNSFQEEPHETGVLVHPDNMYYIDMKFSPPPQFAHFMRIDKGLWKQHVNPAKSHFLSHTFTNDDLHHNTVMLHVPAFTPAMIVWRNKSLMDHPIHLHGYKMEILDIHMPDRNRDCTRADCILPTKYDTPEVLQQLDNSIPNGQAVLKDTFILPAGGAVVTRIQTKSPAVWFAHCHLEMHREDGMAMILNVGNYTAPSNPEWLPDDFPSCSDPFVQSKMDYPACTCYHNGDVVLAQALTGDHRCSRDHLCMHELSEAANLDHYLPEGGGVSVRSEYSIPNYAIAIIVCCIVAKMTALFTFVSTRKRRKKDIMEGNDDDIAKDRAVKLSKLARQLGASTAVLGDMDSGSQLMMKLRSLNFLGKVHHLAKLQWKTYRPGCINIWRVVEVSLLGALVGILFYNVGNNPSAIGLSQKTSLLFFSVTLWTFTRMYPSVGNTHAWFHQTVDTALYSHDRNSKVVYATAAWVSRTMISFSCEAWWPFLHVFIAYPLAGMFGRVDACFKISILLMMNNLCYVAIGSVLGILFPSVPLGMNVSTIVSQTSLVAAGFYTTLPPVIHLIRYISPVFWTFSGILKSVYRTNDTYQCTKGQSDVGVNECYIEYNMGIDLMKRRGINVATFNDEETNAIALEIFMLVVLYIAMNLMIMVYLFHTVRKQKDATAAASIFNSSEETGDCQNVDHFERAEVAPSAEASGHTTIMESSCRGLVAQNIVGILSEND